MTPSKPPYVSPVPNLGPILWAPRPGMPFYSAMVTKADRNAISVIVFAEDSKGGSPRTGVLHATDPRFATLGDQTQGVWDFTADQKELARLLDRSSSCADA